MYNEENFNYKVVNIDVTDDRPSLIKLDNGDNIVVILEQTEQYITVSYPLELVRQEISPTMETVVIQAWASFTDDQEIEIRQQKIVSISNLKQEYVEGYLKDVFQGTQEELEVLSMKDKTVLVI